MIAAPSSATSTSIGATTRGGTLIDFTDSVGMRLTSSSATPTVHTTTTGTEDHQPERPICSSTISGSNTSSPPAGAGTPTKNSLAYGGCSTSSSVLTRASRSTMHTAKTSATIQPPRFGSNRHT